MKAIKYSLFTFLSVALLVSCEKKDYRMGLPEYDNHYYAAYIPNNNSVISVKRNQTDLLKLPVQFYSAFIRDYDAVAFYVADTTGIHNPAVIGVDFNVVDKDGNVKAPSDSGRYTITFPKAQRKMDTIYIKLLNNPVSGTRRVEIQIREHQTDQYDVDIFSTAYRRPIDIK
jgi:hypothetical protein